MKKQILTAALVAGLSAGAFAQGTIVVDNSSNTGNSTATSNGLVYVRTGPTTSVLEQGNVSITMLAGTAGATSLSPVVTILGSANGGDGDGGGAFTDFSAAGFYTLPGITGTAQIELEIWEGSATTFAGAVSQGANWGEVTFVNPLGGGTTQPKSLSGMPSVVLASPEPSTIALGGLGAAALLALRRRK
jgi:hypothetical protein